MRSIVVHALCSGLGCQSGASYTRNLVSSEKGGASTCSSDRRISNGSAHLRTAPLRSARGIALAKRDWPGFVMRDLLYATVPLAVSLLVLLI